MKKNVIQKTVNVINLIQKNLIKRNILKPNMKLLLSISGGQDSASLIFFIVVLKNQWNWDITIVYCNHLWQKKSFFIFLELSKLTYQLNLKLYYTVTLQELINENISRNWRYDVFYRLDYFYNNNFLLTGHTSTDRLETIFFNMIRGSGINSFSFLNWKRTRSLIHEKNDSFYVKKTRNFVLQKENNQLKNFSPYNQEKKDTYYHFIKNKNTLLLFIKNDLPLKLKGKKKINVLKKFYFTVNKKLIKNSYSIKYFFCLKKTYKTTYLIRPLLFLNRYDIKEIIFKTKIMIFLDKTNQTEKYSRNRIRNQLLPTLRFFFNPQIDTLYFQYSEIGSMEEKFFEYIIKKIFVKIKYKSEIINSLDTSLLKNLPIFLQRRIYKKFFEKNLKKNISFIQIEILLKHLVFSNKKNSSKKEKNNFFKFVLYPKIGILLVFKNQLLVLTY